MKFSTLIDIFIELLSKRRVSAAYLAEKYSLSPRTVYRYVEILSQSLPLQVKRGRAGGIYLADQYKLPMGFFTEEEHERIVTALSESYVKHRDERFLQALKKLDSQKQTEFYQSALSASVEDVRLCECVELLSATAEKLRVLEACIQAQTMADVVYEGCLQKVEPHTLVFHENGWGMYAFSHAKRDFHFFRIGKISSIVKLDASYRKRPFELPEQDEPRRKIPVRLEIKEKSLARMESWLGAEHIQLKKDTYIADALLPDGEELTQKLLSFGADVRVITPLSLKNKVAKLAKEIVKLYD